MKFIFTAILLFCYASTLYCQTIEIEPVPAHAGYDTGTFQAGDGTITVSGGRFVLGTAVVQNPTSWSISESNRRAAFLQKNKGVELRSYNEDGDVLIEKEMEFFGMSDNTMKAYQFNDGRVVLRNNVANFSFLNPSGELTYSLSNSSGSSGGERESELAADPSGGTIVVYNPVISYGSQTGSRARIVYGDQDNLVFFRSRREEIKSVRVHEGGSYITMITVSDNGDNAFVFDRFGNELFEISTEEDLLGATLHGNTHLTLFSSSRVQVFEIPGGERLGSASSRSSILYADFDPEAETIIVLGGNLSSMVIENPEIMAVSLSQRELIREEVPFAVSVLNLDRIGITTSGRNEYEISGLNRHLRVHVQF